MSLAGELACPDCGQVSVERAIHNTTPVPCPRCRARRGLAKAGRARLTGERFCPLCEVSIAVGSWRLHEFSKYHRLQVRIHFASLLERQSSLSLPGPESCPPGPGPKFARAAGPP